MDREPIFWTSTQPGYNNADRESVRIGEDGELVKERFPQRGHDGDYDNKQPARRGTRFINMVNHGGHTVAVVLTSAAAALDPQTSFGQSQLAMVRFHGWYQPGECPIALVFGGTMGRNTILSKGILDDRPCEPGTYGDDRPCVHSLLEKKTRMERHEKKELARENAYKDPTARMIDASKEENARLIAAMTGGSKVTEADNARLLAEMDQLKKEHAELAARVAKVK